MGCAASNYGEGDFPLTPFMKDQIRYTWNILLKDDVRFGNTLFYKFLTRNPGVIRLFPEFSPDNIHLLLSFDEDGFHKGHPKKVVLAIHAAVLSIEDSKVFVNRMHALGAKHSKWSLRPEHLKSLSEALIETVKECLGEEYNRHVEKTWTTFYRFIIRNMKYGLQDASKQK